MCIGIVHTNTQTGTHIYLSIYLYIYIYKCACLCAYTMNLTDEYIHCSGIILPSVSYLRQ